MTIQPLHTDDIPDIERVLDLYRVQHQNAAVEGAEAAACAGYEWFNAAHAAHAHARLAGSHGLTALALRRVLELAGVGRCLPDGEN